MKEQAWTIFELKLKQRNCQMLTPGGPYINICVILTHLVNSAGQGEVPVLAVHIMRAGARVVAKPDAIVLDDTRVLFCQLRNTR